MAAPFDALEGLNLMEHRLGPVEFQPTAERPHSLTIFGSLDLSYYHEVEIRFVDVTYVSLPTEFGTARFRAATAEEADELARRIPPEEDQTLYAIESDAGAADTVFFVRAREAVVSLGRVYYYPRAELRAGERIAPWVRSD